MKTPDLRTKLQKKAEVKLDAVGKKIGTAVKKGVKTYKEKVKKADEAYAKSPKGKKAKALYDAGGSY